MASLLSLGVLVDRAESAPAAASRKLRVSELGLEIQATSTTPSRVSRLANGNLRASEKAVVSVKGRGIHNLSGVVEDEPVARGGRQKAVITDHDAGGETMTFTYDPRVHRVTFARAGGSVSIVRNPDHSYAVNGVPAANGKAVVALLKRSPVYSGASSHSVLLAHRYATRPSLAARTSPTCASEACMGSGPNWEGPPLPAVCTLFEDACDCIACDQMRQTDDWWKCPAEVCN
ncbi:hypothetical protein [Nannocystis sp.]|uniref:hypothetical protein n=1 Tax=Nannocystis sp. TaxID=1962667 RepID=UPI0026007DE7|nr:hypothetical protein [Nannocystis sp.]MBK7823647.1 hypothetical protein [Nannocystis sp.]